MNQRYDFIYLFDVKDGNPNGDPDAGNLPRIDAETSHGLVTDVCLKRKIRNYIQCVHSTSQKNDIDGSEQGYDIYVREKAILNQQHERAYKALKMEATGKDGKRKGSEEQVTKARAWMCLNFFDVRAFGAVMSLGLNCGQVRGPVQFTFARSVDPVVTSEHAITRVAVATEKESEAQQGDNRTMGRKFTVPYGLYRAHGFVNAPLAVDTGFSEADLALLWKALEQMFEIDRSASRGEMAARGLLVFRHDDRLGNAPAHTLFDRLTVPPLGLDAPARNFSDYAVKFDGVPLDDFIKPGIQNARDLGIGVTLIRYV